jgi:ATP-binding cassette subfamily C protein CydC
VGPSGAGKTTLVNLLLRFWNPEPGQVFVGERDLLDYTPDQARAFFGVVPQPVHLFNRSIRSNLELARPGATDEEIRQAARQAQLCEFIARLADGYATYVGERGMRLSGGERQRIAIARALLSRAPALLLDEPTANLDALTERDVLGAIHAAAAGRTLLMITHRLIGLERFDEILVLQAGRVVERGTHAELVQAGGWYREMWNEQGESAIVERTLQ